MSIRRAIGFPFVALTLLVLCHGLLGVVSRAAPSTDSNDAAWQTLRQQAINRPRRLIFNNDGNEPVYFCQTATEAELLRSRTAALAGSQVDSIFYCTWSSGFGLFTHDTKVGQVFNTREAMFKDNRTQELLDRGIDPLRVMVKFSREHKLEVFWSMRMNDTHDGSRADYGPVMFRANKLKQDHPEYLIGSQEKPPKRGVWSAVDYGIPEIRDLAFRYCEEVCRNYAVDGIELDFFRHAFFFKASGRGEPCGPTELAQMTDLLRRLRAMTEATGRQRGVPILLAIRVPDSVPYCKFIGLDLERWLADGLIDLLIVSGYTQLNPWAYSVKLGRQYGVKVYPSLDEPRVRDAAANKLRASRETYRGRALNAWAAGVDGIYLFNYFDPHSSLWRELGNPCGLQRLDRIHFLSVRGTGSMPVPHQAFLNVPTLNPADPISLTTNQPARLTLALHEPCAGQGPQVASRRIRLRAQFKHPPLSEQLLLCVDGNQLADAKPIASGWEYELPAALTGRPEVTLEISVRGGAKAGALLTDFYAVVAGN